MHAQETNLKESKESKDFMMTVIGVSYIHPLNKEKLTSRFLTANVKQAVHSNDYEAHMHAL